MRNVLLVAGVILLSGCSRSVQENEVIGSYYLDHEPATSTLDLHADGTYLYSYVDQAGVSSTHGKWEWAAGDTDNLCLDDFKYNGDPQGGYWFFTPEHSWQGIRLPIGDPDCPEHYFIKRSKP